MLHRLFAYLIGGTPSPFDPATLPYTGWWRADYAGAPWAATASAGVSATTGDLYTDGFPATVGTAQNGHTPADFGTIRYLLNATGSTTLWSDGSGGVSGIIKPRSADVATGNFYDDPAVCRDDGAYVVLSYTADGFTALVWTGGAYEHVTVACPVDGDYHSVIARWDGITLGIQVDGGTEVTTPCGPLSISPGPLFVGRGYGGTEIDALMLELTTQDTTPSDGDIANYRGYANDRYAIAA